MSEITVGLHDIPLEPHATKEKVFEAARAAGLDPKYDIYFRNSKPAPVCGVFDEPDPGLEPSRFDMILRFANRLAKQRLARLSILPLQGQDEIGPHNAYVVIVPGVGAECVDSTAVFSLSHHPAPGVHTATVSILSDGQLAVLELPCLKRMFDFLRKRSASPGSTRTPRSNTSRRKSRR